MNDLGADQKASLAVANRILAHHDVLDGYGHVSVRNADDPSRFLLSRNMAPARVTANDILLFGLDGEPVEQTSKSIYLERFIHSSVYAARPEVQAVVHSHSPAVIPFGITDVPLRAVYHMGGFLAEGVPVFEIRDHFGDDTDMLITSATMGDVLASELGDSAVVLMRGHGNVVVATSLKMAVYRAVYTELNARIQAIALDLGGSSVKFLSKREGERTDRVSHAVVDRTWNLWVAQVGD